MDNNQKSLLTPNSSAYVFVEYFLGQGCTLDIDKFTTNPHVAVYMPQTDNGISRSGEFLDALANLENSLFEAHVNSVLSKPNFFFKFFIAWRAFILVFFEKNRTARVESFCWNHERALVWVAKHKGKFFTIYECADGKAVNNFSGLEDVKASVKPKIDGNVIVRTEYFDNFKAVVKSLS